MLFEMESLEYPPRKALTPGVFEDCIKWALLAQKWISL